MSKPDYEEIECKFLDINPVELDKKLASLGAKKTPRRLFRRYVLDFPDWRLDNDHSWLRVRDEGSKVTMSFKKRYGIAKSMQDGGMKEIEVIVDNFDHTVNLFKAVGMVHKFYEENYRTTYDLDNVEIVIDEWPLIPPYVEIEGESWSEVEEMSKKLGFDFKKKIVCSTTQVYKHYGIDEKSYHTLTFKEQIKR